MCTTVSPWCPGIDVGECRPVWGGEKWGYGKRDLRVVEEWKAVVEHHRAYELAMKLVLRSVY
jgi:hypothetical protein